MKEQKAYFFCLITSSFLSKGYNMINKIAYKIHANTKRVHFLMMSHRKVISENFSEDSEIWHVSKTCSNRPGLSIAPTPEWSGHVQAKILIILKKRPASPPPKKAFPLICWLIFFWNYKGVMYHVCITFMEKEKSNTHEIAKLSARIFYMIKLFCFICHLLTFIYNNCHFLAPFPKMREKDTICLQKIQNECG